MFQCMALSKVKYFGVLSVGFHHIPSYCRLINWIWLYHESGQIHLHLNLFLPSGFQLIASSDTKDEQLLDYSIFFETYTIRFYQGMFLYIILLWYNNNMKMYILWLITNINNVNKTHLLHLLSVAYSRSIPR